ncbi:hypothetical protein FISHEDRAFT_60153 [Fistulina hepatica ATCC 64428]|uniref:Uncharacterized protein n=1 Tax=Fistulina hepatica ATCC 64428 TaxID=1128425 RepID=A0A0D7A9Y4_9AGAR|nr:hypothetical protein FISHEDRAFT_60153 [Fistulina hepatica ATCC 64428]
MPLFSNVLYSLSNKSLHSLLRKTPRATDAEDVPPVPAIPTHTAHEHRRNDDDDLELHPSVQRAPRLMPTTSTSKLTIRGKLYSLSNKSLHKIFSRRHEESTEPVLLVPPLKVDLSYEFGGPSSASADAEPVATTNETAARRVEDPRRRMYGFSNKSLPSLLQSSAKIARSDSRRRAAPHVPAPPIPTRPTNPVPPTPKQGLFRLISRVRRTSARRQPGCGPCSTSERDQWSTSQCQDSPHPERRRRPSDLFSRRSSDRLRRRTNDLTPYLVRQPSTVVDTVSAQQCVRTTSPPPPRPLSCAPKRRRQSSAYTSDVKLPALRAPRQVTLVLHHLHQVMPYTHIALYTSSGSPTSAISLLSPSPSVSLVSARFLTPAGTEPCYTHIIHIVPARLRTVQCARDAEGVHVLEVGVPCKGNEDVAGGSEDEGKSQCIVEPPDAAQLGMCADFLALALPFPARQGGDAVRVLVCAPATVCVTSNTTHSDTKVDPPSKSTSFLHAPYPSPPPESSSSRLSTSYWPRPSTSSDATLVAPPPCVKALKGDFVRDVKTEAWASMLLPILTAYVALILDEYAHAADHDARDAGRRRKARGNRSGVRGRQSRSRSRAPSCTVYTRVERGRTCMVYPSSDETDAPSELYDGRSRDASTEDADEQADVEGDDDLSTSPRDKAYIAAQIVASDSLPAFWRTAWSAAIAAGCRGAISLSPAAAISDWAGRRESPSLSRQFTNDVFDDLDGYDFEDTDNDQRLELATWSMWVTVITTVPKMKHIQLANSARKRRVSFLL